MKKITVMIIDDHPMLNYGLASCLEGTDRYKVCGNAVSLLEARQFIENSKKLPSFVILDIMLGEENGLDFLPFLENFCKAKQLPLPPVLICSVLEDPFRIRTAIKMGAWGYISKTSSKTELLEAIDTIIKGRRYISGGHADVLEDSPGVHSKFTKRELDVLTQIKKNKTNQQIADLLEISLRTVENHISNIYFKTGAVSRLELLNL